MPTDQELNPFQSPKSFALQKSPQDFEADFAPILHRWEKLRLWYNAVLISYTLVASATFLSHLLLNLPFLFQLCLGGLFCNIAFLFGPTIEAYGRYFRLWNFAFTWILFALGLCLTVLMATAFLIMSSNQP